MLGTRLAHVHHWQRYRIQTTTTEDWYVLTCLQDTQFPTSEDRTRRGLSTLPLLLALILWVADWLEFLKKWPGWQLSMGEGEDGPTSVCTARILYVLCRNRNSPRGSCLQEAPCLERNEDTWTCHQDQTSSFQNPSQRDLDTGKLTFYYNVLDRRREPFVLPRASDTRSLHCSLCEISFFKIGLKVI